MPAWYDATLIKREDINDLTSRFWLEIPAAESIDFIPGQFITIDLPIHEKRRMRWKSYSIASHPNGTNVIELCIVFQEGGLGTTYLFKEAKIGTKLRFKGPLGVFTIPKNLDQEIVMIATGTGVAPFRSIMNHIQAKDMSFQKIHVIFGTRVEDGILYREEFEALAEKYPNFSYDVALSREDDWDGYKGYLHQIYKEKYSAVIEGRKFYLCGWRNMIDEAIANLEQIGYKEEQIIYELYG